MGAESEQNAIRELQTFEACRTKRASRVTIDTPDETDLWGTGVLIKHARSRKSTDDIVDELGWEVPKGCSKRASNRKSSTGKRNSRSSLDQTRRNSRKSVY